ncbi:unnamed protein product [Hymenolepis diminuta]|uniref:BPL/LPL catalytic domain-containing protein n=1 Tax=Hymenolepis diminuta TaxID=6216 RepID=A0A0R3SSU8_HYMDI|nr:unnamed protein product [Hymenolepis diminuta]VUZ45807.1 unnamed protein product [Hymenolepis diminuta]
MFLSKVCVTRGFSSLATKKPINRIYWLASGDIFRNLAFEVCFYDNRARYAVEEGSQYRPADMLFWRSDPCVVIGRNQNVWLESSPREIEGRGWQLARRMSGGGAVFHDHGNLNISFLEAKKHFDRQKCMEFLRDSLMKRWPKLNIFVGSRYDLWLLPDDLSLADLDPSKIPEGAKKISGSASRFSSKIGLHHCTLLFNTSLTSLASVLQPAVPEIMSRASKSIQSEVTNIAVPEEELKSTLFNAGLEWLKMGARDGQVELVTVNPGEEGNWVDAGTFERNLTNFQSWDWVYGDTPKFTIPMEADDGTVLCLHCEKGRIAKLEQTGGPIIDTSLLQRFSSAITGKQPTSPWVDKLNEALVGKKLQFMEIHEALMEVETELSAKSDGLKDPYEHVSQIIDRLRGMATCF